MIISTKTRLKNVQPPKTTAHAQFKPSSQLLYISLDAFLRAVKVVLLILVLLT